MGEYTLVNMRKIAECQLYYSFIPYSWTFTLKNPGFRPKTRLFQIIFSEREFDGTWMGDVN